jgi:AraC family transcriptional regulator
MQRLSTRQSFGDCARRFDAAGTLVGDTRLPPGAVLPRHGHDAAYVCIVLDGRYAEISHHESRCAPGSVLVHPAGHVHADRIGREGARCINVEFEPGLLHGDAARTFAPWLQGEHHVRLPPATAALRRLAEALDETDDLAPLQVHAAALDLLCLAARARVAVPPERRSRPIERVVDRLEAALDAPPTLDELARIAELHPHHLMRVFRAQRGETIGGYVRRRRLEGADDALRDGGLPVVEIALRAGFCDQSHFTRAYRRQFGRTPGQRRRGG